MEKNWKFRRDEFWREMSPEVLREMDIATAIAGLGRLKKVPIDFPTTFVGSWIIGGFLLKFSNGRGSEYHIRACYYEDEETGYLPLGLPNTPIIDREVCEIIPRFAFLPWPNRKRIIRPETFFE